ncbi:MAG: 16S rRNA processing protein RimM [Desulfovibrionaceae bacterium]|nr:16S rRNA processing protein RimM [Desulfovibrionaceae bacterium]
MSAQQPVLLGRLARPHSIRGEIRVDYYADSPLLLDKPLLLRAGEGAARPVRVASWRTWRDQLIIRLEGVTDRGAAEMLRGQELLIDAAHLPETDPDEPYLHDILGLPVLLTATGESVGVLDNVLFPAGQEVWSIRNAEGHEILFPAVPEFVDRIDIEAGQILITPPEGLFDLYLPAGGKAAPLSAGGASAAPHAAAPAPDTRPPAARA